MKIAIVTPVYPPYKGGMGAVAADNARQLRARGLDVAVYTPDYGHGEKNPEATYVAPLFTFGNAAVLPGLLHHLNKTDVTHLHYTFYGADVFVWLWSVLKRRPYVLTYHMRPKVSDFRQVIFRLHLALIEPWILARARAVLVSSRDYADALGLRHRNLIELPFGVDTQRFNPGTDLGFRERYKLPAETCVYLFVGGLDRAHSFKGVDVLLRAAAQLPATKSWRLLIVGDGDMRQSYETLAAELGLKDRVIFAGGLSATELPSAYRAANIHVLPSTSQSEAYGLVTLEAGASALPSVVSNLPGVRTLVSPGESGFVVEPGDITALAGALERFLIEPGLAQKLGQTALRRVRQGYSEAGLADRLVEVYKSVAVSGHV